MSPTRKPPHRDTIRDAVDIRRAVEQMLDAHELTLNRAFASYYDSVVDAGRTLRKDLRSVLGFDSRGPDSSDPRRE